VGADPPHRVSRTSARLEEPPKPSQSLSVAVATKAPVRAFPLRAPSAGSARREARGAFTLEARAAGTRPWFRGTHPRLGHPSIVSAVARSRPLDFPSPRARTPPDAIPTEACACGLDRRTSPLIERRRDGPRTPFTRARRRRLVWPRRFLRARSRVSLMRYSRKGASRPKMRPIDFCTPKPFPLEHPYVVASQRSHRGPRAAPFGAASRIGSLSFRSRFLRPLRARPRERPLSRFACCAVRPKTRGAGTFRLGAVRRKRDWGESRFTARFPLWRPVDRGRGRCLPSTSIDTARL